MTDRWALVRGLLLALYSLSLILGGIASQPASAATAPPTLMTTPPTLAFDGATVIFGLRGHEPDGDPFYFVVIAARLHGRRSNGVALPNAHLIIAGYLERFQPRTRPRLLDVLSPGRVAGELSAVMQGQAALVDAGGRLAYRGRAVADVWRAGALHLLLDLQPAGATSVSAGLRLSVRGEWAGNRALAGTARAVPASALATLAGPPESIPPWQMVLRSLTVPLPPMLGKPLPAPPAPPVVGVPDHAVWSLAYGAALSLAVAFVVVWWPARHVPPRSRSRAVAEAGRGTLGAVRPRRAHAARWVPRSRRMALPVVPTALLLGALAVLGWALLVTWYGVAGHYAMPYFSFGAIKGYFDAPILRGTAVVFLALAVIYGGVYMLLRGAPRLTLALKGVIVLLVLVPAFANLLLYPVGAIDVYNYGATLKLTYYYHQNPYLTTFSAHPADPAMRFAFMWTMPLPYGPLGVLLGGVPAAITGFGDAQRVVLGLKALNLALLLLAGLLIYRYQVTDRRGWLAAYLFLANPLVLFEGVGNGHNDVLMTALLIGAVAALKERPLLALPLLALSVLTKFFTLALAPVFLLALWQRDRDARRLAVPLLLSLAVVAAVCAPFWAGGQMIAGLSKGITISEAMRSASLFSLARELAGLRDAAPALAALVQPMCDGLFVAGALIILQGVLRGRAVEAALIDTFLLFSLLLSLLFPWYFIAVLALMALRGTRLHRPFMVAVTALGLLYYPLSVWAWFNSGLDAFGVHLFQAPFLTLPILAFLGREVHLWWAARQIARAVRTVGRTK